MSFDFAKIAPFLKDPIILVGFFLLLAFGFVKYLLKKELLSQLSKIHSYKILKTIIILGFVIGLLLILLGFGLKYKELSKNNEQRVVYANFLERVNRKNSLVISEILSVGSLIEKNADTDYEIQKVENKLFEVLQKRDINEIYLELKDDMNILQLHGSSKVKIFASDILEVLLLHFDKIHLSFYSLQIQGFIQEWTFTQRNGIGYGYESRVTEEERLSLLLIAKLFDNLINTMNSEIV